MTFPAGPRYELRHEGPLGHVTASITGVAAAIQELRVAGTDLVPPYEGRAPLCAGTVQAPWPNRVADGEWTQNGITRQLAITEPEYRHALHGLLMYTEYQVVELEPHRVVLAATVYPQIGYPFLLETAVEYLLEADGIRVTHFVENVGTERAPFAIGAHPYCKIGGAETADLTLRLSATTHLPVNERLIPGAPESVTGTEWDLAVGRRVGDLMLDDGFGGVTAAGGQHTLTAPDGSGLAVWSDATFDYVQVFTTREFPGEDLAIAVEPMTAPANAFNSGIGLRWLGLGASWQGSWGIRYLPAPKAPGAA